MEQKKKVTNAQLQRRIQNAIVFIPRDKEYKEVFFSDKGLRLEVNADTAVISTGYHRHIFHQFTNLGISRPWLYVKRLIEIANSNDCKTDKGYSFKKLLEVLGAKEERNEYNICMFVDWWLFNIFQPLYSIGETEAESFLVYESYIHNIARNAILLSEKNEDVTNKQFIGRIIENMKEYTDDMEEHVIFPKKSDEEVAKENIEAATEMELNETTEERDND